MYKFDILTVEGFDVINDGKKTIYNNDGNKNYLDVIKQNTQYNGEKIDFPNMYGSLNFRENGKGIFYKDSLGYFVCEGDTVEGNPSSVFLISGPSYRNRGVNINKSNIFYVTSYFASRMSVKMDWKNQKDVYMFNKTQISDDSIADTIVYSLFNNSSFQSSANMIHHNGKTFRVTNNFFWMDINEIMEKADEIGFDELYNSTRGDNNRFIYELIYGKEGIYDSLSEVSKNLLRLSKELFYDVFEIRQSLYNEENQLNMWDAGYSQLKGLWKEYSNDRFTEFRKKYKELEIIMNQRTYELGFLKN